MNFLAKLEKALDWITSAILAMLLLIVWAQVTSRYILNDSLTWTEEAARYLMIWGVLLGVNIALMRGYLISITVFSDKFPARLQPAVQVVRKLLSLFFTGILAVYGVKLCMLGANMESPAIGIRYLWIYLAVPVGATLLFLLFLFDAGNQKEGEALAPPKELP